MGYLYWQFLYQHFDLDLMTLELPFPSVLIGTFITVFEVVGELVAAPSYILRHWELLLPSGGFVIFTYIYAIALFFLWLLTPMIRGPKRLQVSPRASLRMERLARFFQNVAGWYGGVLIFLILVVMPVAQAGYDGRRNSGTEVWAELFFKKGEESTFGEELVRANNQKKLRLLIETKDLIVVYIAAVVTEINGKPRVPTFVLPRSNLQAIRIQVVKTLKSPARDRIGSSAAPTRAR